MKESYRKGFANHPRPEPCEGSREAAFEALYRDMQAGKLSSENRNVGADGVTATGKQQSGVP